MQVVEVDEGDAVGAVCVLALVLWTSGDTALGRAGRASEAMVESCRVFGEEGTKTFSSQLGTVMAAAGDDNKGLAEGDSSL